MMNPRDLSAKFAAFGFETIDVADGNDIEQVLAALKTQRKSGMPRFLNCYTKKGAGVSFMENQLAWHAKQPTPEEYAAAIKELEAKQ